MFWHVPYIESNVLCPIFQRVATYAMGIEGRDT